MLVSRNAGMKITLLSIALLFGAHMVAPALGMQVGQDMKDIGHGAKNAATDGANATKKGVKKGWHKTKNGVKKGAHKGADATEKGAQKVKDKTDTSTQQ